jgi:hypothetical protein
MTACATTKIEYVREIPAVTFPVFPPPDCVEYDEEMDTVSMPLWYWQKIAEYKIDVDAAQDYLTALRGQADVERMRILSETGKKKTGARRRRSDTEGMEALARKTREKTDKKMRILSEKARGKK